MGFYAPAQIIDDAKKHGVEVKPVDINNSFWDNVMEKNTKGGLDLRLGFRQIRSMRKIENIKRRINIKRFILFS